MNVKKITVEVPEEVSEEEVKLVCRILTVRREILKDILEELYRKGKVTLISRSRRTAIYVPIDIAKKIEVPISPF